MSEKFPFVNLIIENSVASIDFFHPSHNSLPGELLEKLTKEINTASKNEDVRIISIKSEGDRTFCAGASFTELVNIDNLKQGKDFFLGFANVINAIRKSSKIVIISLQGKAVGGGVGLASAADYCLATKWASVRLSELAVGIGPFVIGPAVERKVGISNFSAMSLQPNTWYDADWCKSNGLFHEVFESKGTMEEYESTFINTLLSFNPLALKGLKEVFWKGTEHWDTLLAERAEMSGNLVLSKYVKEAISGFLEGKT